MRYAIGTVVGAMCVYFVLDMLGPEAKVLWLMQPDITELNIWDLGTICSDNPQACLVQAQITQDLYGFNLAQLILLGIYGLAFTYFASGPVLVWHAVRSQFIQNLPCANEKASRLIRLIVFLAFLVVVTSLGSLARPDCEWLVHGLLFSAAIYALVQVWLLIRSDFKQSFSYLKKLHVSRKSKCIESNSYKHLREHGNAFLLVLHNVMLLGVIFAIIQTLGEDWLILTLLWILPAAGVYILGHKLEAELVADRQCKKNK